MGRNRRRQWVDSVVAITRVKAKPRGVYWIEGPDEHGVFRWYVRDPEGHVVPSKGRYTKEYRAAMAAENHGYVRGEAPSDGTGLQERAARAAAKQAAEAACICGLPTCRRCRSKWPKDGKDTK